MKTITHTTYHFSADSKISAITASGSNGSLEVKIQAGENSGDLSMVPSVLHRYGFPGAYVGTENGRDLLKISGVKDKDLGKLVDVLKSNALTAGEPSVDNRREQSSGSWFQDVQEDALRWSGKTGIAGHIALMARGFVMGGGSLNQVGQGMFGMTVPAILSVAGNGQDGGFDSMIHEMRAYFEKEGVPFPDGQKIEDQRKSFATTAAHFLKSHSLPIAVGVVGNIGAFMGIRGAMAEGNVERALASGASMTGNMVVLAVPENKSSNDAGSPIQKLASGLKDIGKATLHPSQLPGALSNFVSQGPVAVMGLINLADNVLFGKAAWREYKDYKHANENPQTVKNEIAELEAANVSLREGAIAKQKEIVSGKLAKDISRRHPEIKDSEKLNDMVGKAAKELDGAIVANAKQIAKNEGKIGILAKQIFISDKEPMRGKIALGLSCVTLLSWGMASSLAAISSKNASKKQQEEGLDRLYSAMAKLLVEVPKEQREPTLNLMSGFLSSKPELQALHLNSEKLVGEIRGRLETLDHSHWVSHVHPVVNIDAEPLSQQQAIGRS